MKTNRLVGAVVTPLPTQVSYLVMVPVKDDSGCEWMAPTAHVGRAASMTLAHVAYRWAQRLDSYVQLYAHPFGTVASAWPNHKEHA